MSTESSEREKLVRHLVQSHFQLEDGIERIVWFQNGGEEDVRLVEVNRNSITTGSFDAFGFAASPEFPLCLQTADVTPQEWEKIERREWELPLGWNLDQARIFERDSESNRS